MWGPIQLPEMPWPRDVAPKGPGCSGKNRDILGQPRAQIPRISKGFIDFLGLFGKGGLERVAGIEPA